MTLLASGVGWLSFYPTQRNVRNNTIDSNEFAQISLKTSQYLFASQVLNGIPSRILAKPDPQVRIIYEPFDGRMKRVRIFSRHNDTTRIIIRIPANNMPYLGILFSRSQYRTAA